MTSQPRHMKRNIILFISLVVIASFLWWSSFWTVENPCQEGGFWDVEAGVCIYPQDAQNPTLPPETAAAPVSEVKVVSECSDGQVWDAGLSTCVAVNNQVEQGK